MKSKNKKAIEIVIILSVIIAVSVFTAVIPSLTASESMVVRNDTDLPSISEAKSIVEIENLKSNLTDAQKKLSTNLLQLLDSSFIPEGQDRETLKMEMENLGQFRPASSVSPTSDGRVAGDLVYVYVYLKPLAGTQTIKPYVWEVTDRDEENHLAVAWVEVKDLEILASLEAVRTIRTVMPPLVRTGSVTTEGDAIHRTSDVRTIYSQNGSGVGVGIISDGVDHWTDAQSSGDLPADLTVLSNTQGGDEGTAMLEIVHDMVPGADLYFHDCGANTVAFNAAIDALVTAGCDVVCDDIGWITQPFFEDGIVASHLTSVLTSNDIIYVSSAGNAGQRHYQGDYYNDGYDFHDFSKDPDSNDYLYVNIPNNGEVTVVLQWNDEFGFSGNDYDLYLFDTADWSILASSTYIQDGNDDPLEAFSYTNTGGSTIDAEIDVHNYNGAAETKTLEVFIYPSSGAGVYTNNIDSADSIFGHAAVPNAIAVGAIDASDPGNDDIEPFSSQGPVTISYPSPVSRPKPDLCGIDGVTVTGAGGFTSPFYGTSAAAPHIAAIAAQLWGAFPAKTGDEIRTTLYSSALDLGSAGYDNIFGYGRADALDAFEAIAQPDIWVDPASFEVTSLQNTSEDYMLRIGNDGDATLTYNITDNSSWLDENPESGSVEPGNYDIITVSINTTGLSTGDYSADINITSNDPDESLITVPVHLTVKPVALIFDTEQPKNPYPCIFGTHNGTITPNVTIYNVSRLYTYSCAGTGGHSESVAFFNATTEIEIANGTWNGYQGASDYHCIEFDVPFTLHENETYNYTIRTGSYPQIHHNKTLATANGWINCTKFTDANGKEYTDWIPAIKLE
ncbi:MAG: S8 family serine peptidase [Methanophagales archaeon]|nr:S8 family serine peptidase [Methanophagales archaeon]